MVQGQKGWEDQSRQGNKVEKIRVDCEILTLINTNNTAI